jgi:hypothetical protein
VKRKDEGGIKPRLPMAVARMCPFRRASSFVDETATGSQAVSPNSLPTAARSRCGARRAALTSFLAHSPLYCGCNSSARPSFRPENDARTGSLIREGHFDSKPGRQMGSHRSLARDCPQYPLEATGMPLFRTFGAGPEDPQFSAVFLAKNLIWQRSPASSATVVACRLFRQPCLKVATCEARADRLKMSRPAGQNPASHPPARVSFDVRVTKQKAYGLLPQVRQLQAAWSTI